MLARNQTFEKQYYMFIKVMVHPKMIHLLTLMLFQTSMALFLMWNTKSNSTGAFEVQKACKSTTNVSNFSHKAII